MTAVLGQFARFALIGGIATLIQYAVLLALVQSVGFDPVWASAVGYALSAVFNYLMNYRYTFSSQARHGPATLKFAAIAGLGLVLNSLVMGGLISSDVHFLIAQVVATVVVLFWNFFGARCWTFRTD